MFHIGVLAAPDGCDGYQDVFGNPFNFHVDKLYAPFDHVVLHKFDRTKYISYTYKYYEYTLCKKVYP